MASGVSQEQRLSSVCAVLPWGDREQRTLHTVFCRRSLEQRPAKITQTAGLESSAPQLAWASFHRTPLLEVHISFLSPLQNKESGQGHLEESQRFAVHRKGRQPRQTECRDLYGKVIDMDSQSGVVTPGFRDALVPSGRSRWCLNHSSQKPLCLLRRWHSCYF